jgi:3-deoxy-D-manno-octulosonate 8-phosphate phosphatase KdsC-like HAD superfamily phosphatase
LFVITTKTTNIRICQEMLVTKNIVYGQSEYAGDSKVDCRVIMCVGVPM